MKFTPKGGQIQIVADCLEVKNQRTYDRIVIKDTGIGMTDEFLKKIYEPFSQEDHPLNLMIAQNVIEKMQMRLMRMSQNRTKLE